MPVDRRLPAQAGQRVVGHARDEAPGVGQVDVEERSFRSHVVMVIILSGMGQATSRERIVQAAAEVFAEAGYEGAALADIARRAGCTTGAIYGYFRGKAELLLEALRTALIAEQDAAPQATQVGIGDGRLRFEAIAAHFLGQEAAPSRALVVEAHVAAR